MQGNPEAVQKTDKGKLTEAEDLAAKEWLAKVKDREEKQKLEDKKNLVESYFDPNAYYETKVFGTLLHHPARYTNLQPIGMGSYGVVASAWDRFTKQTMAIKKILKPNVTQMLAKRTYRELKLLKHLKHDNLINLHDLFLSPAGDMYFVTELLYSDLHCCIKAAVLKRPHVVCLFYQIMKGLKYLHSAGVIHRDLKPGNILVSKDCVVKICDFGLARIVDSQMTGYVATRYYRAPEIMMSWQMYDSQMDIWSAGCILAEMLRREPLFRGRDSVHQYSAIAEYLGTPPDEVIQNISSERTRRFVLSISPRPRIPFHEIFVVNQDEEIDLLEKMLVYDPKTRITAVQALEHPFFDDYRDPSNEPTAQPFDWSFSELELPLPEWKEKFRQEVIDFIYSNPSTPARGPTPSDQSDKSKVNPNVYEEALEKLDDISEIPPQQSRVSTPFAHSRASSPYPHPGSSFIISGTQLGESPSAFGGPSKSIP